MKKNTRNGVDPALPPHYSTPSPAALDKIMSKRPCDTVIMKHLMERFEESLSLYHCIRIVHDPSKREEDQLTVCDTRIAVFTSGDSHTFRHSMDTQNTPVVWTAPDWTHYDISRYFADPGNQNLLEPDDPSLDTFYVVCRERPTPLRRSQEVGKDTLFMDHVEDMVKTSAASARVVRERTEERNRDLNFNSKGKGKGGKGVMLPSKKTAMMAAGNRAPSSVETVKAHLISVILPYICHLCKNPSEEAEEDTGYTNPPDGRFTNSVDNTALVYVSEASTTGSP